MNGGPGGAMEMNDEPGASALLVVFLLDQQRYALHLSAVETVVSVVEQTPLPEAPPIITGLINMRGRPIPLFNVRRRFGLVEREPELTDHLIIARTTRRTVGMVVDEVVGTDTRRVADIVNPDTILPHLRQLEGVVPLEDGMMFIHDLDAFLSLDEEKELDTAMERLR